MLGWREPHQISRDLERLERKGIEVTREEIREIDPTRRRVRTERREFYGDYLIISLGAEGWLGGVPGLAESGYNLYELDGTLRLRDALTKFREGRVAVLSRRFRSSALPRPTKRPCSSRPRSGGAYTLKEGM